MPCFFLDLGATRHIKEGDRTGGIPIIALTARAMTGEETATTITGMDGRITVLETTMSGTVQVTAILRNGNAIHSRHTTVDGSTFVPSQAYGTCR